MKQAELQKLYVTGVYVTRSLLVREEQFDLKSGGKSHLYLNHNNFLVQSKYLSVVADLYTQTLEDLQGEYSLGVVDSIMSPIIVGVMCTRMKRNLLVVRATKVQHGVKDDVFGDPRGEVVLIDDMTSTGSTILEAARKIRGLGGTVTTAVVSASRDGAAKENLAREGITLRSVFTFDEIIALLENELTPRELEIVALERELRSRA